VVLVPLARETFARWWRFSLEKKGGDGRGERQATGDRAREEEDRTREVKRDEVKCDMGKGKRG
jgi:hypothetical protein